MHQISNISYLNFLINSGITSFLQDIPNNIYNNSLILRDGLITDVKNLEELKIFIKDSNKDIKKNVFGRGNPNAKFMLIGEAPSIEEELKGKPFVGKSEILLNKMLSAIKIDLMDTYMVNVIPLHYSKHELNSNEKLLEYLPIIQRYIELIKPSIIILLGSLAAKLILNSNVSISKLRGSWHKYNSINIKDAIDCIVTYNPYFLIDTPSYKKQSWEDLQIIERKISNEKL